MKKGCFGKDEGFIVQSLFFVFYYLERVSLFFWLRAGARWRFERKKRKNKKTNAEKKPFVMTYIFPEIWVVGNLIFATISHFFVRHLELDWLIYVLIAYSVERTLEMFVYQVNVLFFHRLNPVFIEQKASIPEKGKRIVTEEYAIKSSARTVWMLILNMVEYVLQFAVIFAAAGTLQQDYSMHISLLESFQLFMSLGGLDSYSSGILMTVAYIETIIGIFMNILCLARFIGALPEVREKGYSVEKKIEDD